MAITATISSSPTTLLINQPCTNTLIINNSGSGALNVISVTPFCTFTGDTFSVVSVAQGVVNLGPGAAIAVPAGGTLGLSYQTTFFAPSTGPIGAGTGTYSITASIVCSDGSVTTPTASTVTVNPLPLPVTEQ
jgi:hypothetical protein